jgi:hypothetical protein
MPRRLETTSAWVRLELLLDVVPVAGVISAASAEAQSFSGWTELFAAARPARAAERGRGE